MSVRFLLPGLIGRVTETETETLVLVAAINILPPSLSLPPSLMYLLCIESGANKIHISNRTLKSFCRLLLWLLLLQAAAAAVVVCRCFNTYDLVSGKVAYIVRALTAHTTPRERSIHESESNKHKSTSDSRSHTCTQGDSKLCRNTHTHTHTDLYVPYCVTSKAKADSACIYKVE